MILRVPSPLRRAALLAAGLLLAAGPAPAQDRGLCGRYRAELAALPAPGGGAQAAEAGRQRAELGRLSAQYRSLGCDRGETFFFTPPERECAALARRIRVLQSEYAGFAQQADPYGERVEERRRQLRAAVEYHCRPRRDVFDDIGEFFGLGPERPRRAPRPVEPEAEGPDAPEAGEAAPRRALGGGRLVCVRACDGYYFPLANMPSGDAGPDDMCQALCPGADAAAYRAPHGDGDIGQAVSLRGQPYAELPGAFRFRKRFDPGCSCRKPGQSWAEALRTAEQMIEQGRTDIVVTAEKAEELSRPPPPGRALASGRVASGQGAQGAQGAAAAQGAGGSPPRGQGTRATGTPAAGGPAPPAEPPPSLADVPTAGTDSAGIGPQTITGDQPLGRGAGRRQEMGAGGARRSVRVLEPGEGGQASPP